ncbi:hypothetical protein V8G54_016469, partial [Vigna mungo]
HRICCVNELFMGNNLFSLSFPDFPIWIMWFYGFVLLAPDTHVVLVTCPAAVAVEKANFLNSASLRRNLIDELRMSSFFIAMPIKGFMFCLQQLACIFSIIACIVGNSELREASRLLSCLADFVYCITDFSLCSLSLLFDWCVPACSINGIYLQTQHKTEMDKRDGKFGPQPIMGVPNAQQMSRFDQAVPPFVGYSHV